MTERPSGTPRLLSSALATTTLPLVVLGSAALAAPAAADGPRQALAPRAATPVSVDAAQARLAAAHLPSSIPASFTGSAAVTAARTSGTHTVKSGDTLYGIATRNGISLTSLLKANGLSKSSIIHPGQRITLPGGSGSSGGTSSSATSAKTHTVKSGDTLYGIASRNGISLSSLLKANGLSKSSIIHPGQTITLGSGRTGTPASGTAASTPSSASSSAGSYTVKSGDTLSGIAARHGLGLSTLLRANGISASTTIYPGQSLALGGTAPSGSASSSGTAPATAGSYTVKAGDTLYRIALRNGISLSALLSANGLTQSSIIHPGQRLSLSSSSIGTAASDAGEDLVPNSFLGRTYPDHVVRDANINKRALLDAGVPSRSQMQAIVADTARQMGVDPALALAHAFTESSFNHASVSPANAIGTMQVIPSSGGWASELVGRELNLMDPYDNAVAGVAIIRQLHRTAGSFDVAVGAYYQGLGGIQRHGMYSDTKDYVAKVKNYMKRF